MTKGVFQKIQDLDASLSHITGFDRLTVFVRDNRALLIFLCVVGIIAYGGDIFNFSLNIDSENHALDYGAKAGWVAQGRWGMYFLSSMLLPDAIMPVIPMLIAVAGSAIGALFLVHTLSSSRGIADYLAAPIAIACPVIYFAFYFTTLGYGVGIAFAVTGYGMYMLTRWTWSGAIVAALCFCFGIGIYQAVMPLIAVIFLLYLVSSVIHGENISVITFIKQSAVFILVMCLAYFLYEIVKRWSLSYVNISFDSGYMSGFISYKNTWEYFSTAIGKTLPKAYNYYTGGSTYYLYDLLVLKALFFLTLIVSILAIARANNPWFVRMLAMLALFLAIITPMLMHVLNSGYMPPRTVMGVPQVLAGLVFFTMSSRSKALKSITAVLVIACVYKFCVINNRYSFSNAMVWQADRELSLSIQQRIATVLPKISPEKDHHAVYPIELVGWVEYTESPIFIQREVVGASFYKWAAGDVERVERLFRTMAVFNYRAATQAERISVVEEAKKMPDWPYDGSVDVINGVIVVKIREYNPNQFLSMCSPPFETDPVCVNNLPR